MEESNKEKFVLELIDRIDKKREEVNKLTSEITELAQELSAENILRIKQNVNRILYAVSSFCPASELDILHNFRLKAKKLIEDLEDMNEEDSTASQVLQRYRSSGRVTRLNNFCIEVNAWNPMKEFILTKKGSTIHLTINVSGIHL